MVKKFFKTYYALPDKRDRIDVVFERGYQNIAVRFNQNEVASFKNAGSLLEAKEITTPEGRLIHLRFLKDTTDFEVFLDGIQIDNSETSPKKVIANLNWPIYLSLSWYGIVLIFSFFYARPLFDLIRYNPWSLLTNMAVFYMVTSTILAVIVLLTALIFLRKGSTALYLIAMIVVIADLAMGAIYQLGMMFLVSGSVKMVFIFALLIPFLFKYAAVSSFVRNWKKFKQFSHMQSLQNRKSDPALIDS